MLFLHTKQKGTDYKSVPAQLIASLQKNCGSCRGRPSHKGEGMKCGMNKKCVQKDLHPDRLLTRD